nr:hypothetical protein [Halomonas sp.]
MLMREGHSIRSIAKYLGELPARFLGNWLGMRYLLKLAMTPVWRVSGPR